MRSEFRLERFAVAKNVYEAERTLVEIPAASLAEGVNHLETFIVVREGGRVAVYDRRCDHRGGRLVTRPDGTVACPLHGWEFDPAAGAYANVDRAKSPVLTTRLAAADTLIQAPHAVQRRVLPDFASTPPVRVRHLNHACVIVETPYLKFALDPWLIGPAFCRGWWLAAPSPEDAFAELDDCDFIYVSHNHPDHLHPETLAHVRRDMPILTAGFGTGSTRSCLAELGFATIHELSLDQTYIDARRELCFGAVKSGDFRDDSGFIFKAGAFVAVFTVDSNHLDFFRFPRQTTLLATSFASGASGYPLCFDTVPDDRKRAIVARNRNAARAVNRTMIAAANPRHYMPYAGMFVEAAARDGDIARLNVKNRIADFAADQAALDFSLIDVGVASEHRFLGDRLVASAEPTTGRLAGETSGSRIEAAKAAFPAVDLDHLSQYFRASGFAGPLTLILEPCDDAFRADRSEACRVEFRPGAAPVTDRLAHQPDLERLRRETGVNILKIRVRREALAEVVATLSPWEDMLIGFQCRIDRAPDVYNSSFWHHFTNVHVKRNAVRAARACGGCERVAQSLAAAG